ncbi:exocyst complex component 5 [Aplysia californica]|uniref:Exocyst complex component 5 n=1 Tax=Aplysia californica TaxID=6500 RepID=A0ABM0JT81_APLCA|nr:exocyst complex component 5 [Aplysia californica]
MSVEELEQEPFSVHEFVERLAWKTMGAHARSSPEEFDPDLLHKAFEKMIRDLKDKNNQVQRKIDRLEAECKDEEKRHWNRVAELQKKNQSLYTDFQTLDERISYVATKVVHLGDQLEGVNTPRARAVEAHKLMNYLGEFLTEEPLKSPVLVDPFQLHLTADVIQKLHLIALELPVGGRFDIARQRIAEKYDEVERELIEEFRLGQQAGDRRQMRKITNLLQHFKSYGQCIDVFIVECQKDAYKGKSIFDDVVPLCVETNKLAKAVFSNSDTVMSKLVQSVFQERIQGHVASRLEKQSDPEVYLNNLYDMYVKTLKLTVELSKACVEHEFKLGDSTFLNKLTRSIFSQHLDKYIEVELQSLRLHCSVVLQHYYEKKDHVKRQIQSGGIHELKRDIQAKIGNVTKAGPSIENFGGETFLSQEVAINILQDTKNAFKRCQTLSSTSDLPSNAIKIFEVLVQYLVTEHIDYAVEIGLLGIPPAEPKVEPEIYFFDVVSQANTLFHLFEKQFTDNFIPLVMSSQHHGFCMKKKRELREAMEAKIDVGLDRSVNAIIGFIRYIFNTEQKKTDFRPETEDAPMHLLSPAAMKVSKFLHAQVREIKNSLDGKNVDVVMGTLGQRYHRLTYEHLTQFSYNSIGAMLVICDVNEYRKLVKEELKVPIVTQLFEHLHALCNLLVVVPENIKVVSSGEQLADLDDSIIQNFVQLRADYRTAKISTRLK